MDPKSTRGDSSGASFSAQASGRCQPTSGEWCRLNPQPEPLIANGATELFAHLALDTILESGPKSLRWRLRARVGQRVRWYELPEEDVD